MIPRTTVMPFDYIEDSARILARAMDRGEPGEEYIVANEPRTFVEVFDVAEELTGVSAPRAVPNAVVRGLGRVMDGVERFRTPPDGFEGELLRFLGSGQVLVDNSKAERELGIEHRPLEEGLREYLDWEMAQLGMTPERPEEVQRRERPSP